MSFRLALVPSLACALLPLGCAYPGQPKSPSLRLPDIPKTITAERVGDQVVFTWTTPSKTTDGDPIRGNITAVLCRETPTNHPTCNPIQRVPVVPGPSRATESLPPALTSGPPTLLTYRLELLNPASRSAGRSDPIYAAAGAAPAPFTAPLTITARREGAVITWPRTTDPAPVYLTRTLIPPPGAPKPAPAKTPGLSAPKAEPLVVKLRPEGQPAADPGGLIDHTVRDGNVYTYTGERIQAVTLSGHPLELHGLASTAATFTYRDIFPPATPTGLASIPGGGFGEAPSIDLTWDPNPESDILGYNVYRADPGTPFTRLNPDPIPTSAYRDLRVEPGHSYLYRVTAIDQHKNESAPSAEIHETLRK